MSEDLEPLPEYQPPPSRMPPEIAKAIVAVKAKVKMLGKEDENRFGKFKFVSVDQFYEMIGPLMAEAGLLIVTDEAEATF